MSQLLPTLQEYRQEVKRILLVRPDGPDARYPDEAITRWLNVSRQVYARKVYIPWNEKVSGPLTPSSPVPYVVVPDDFLCNLRVVFYAPGSTLPTQNAPGSGGVLLEPSSALAANAPQVPAERNAKRVYFPVRGTLGGVERLLLYLFPQSAFPAGSSILIYYTPMPVPMVAPGDQAKELSFMPDLAWQVPVNFAVSRMLQFDRDQDDALVRRHRFLFDQDVEMGREVVSQMSNFKKTYISPRGD